MLSNREASFSGSGIGRREEVEGGGKRRRDQACLDILDGPSLQHNPQRTPFTGLRVMGVGAFRTTETGRQRRERGTVRDKRL